MYDSNDSFYTFSKFLYQYSECLHNTLAERNEKMTPSFVTFLLCCIIAVNAVNVSANFTGNWEDCDELTRTLLVLGNHENRLAVLSVLTRNSSDGFSLSIDETNLPRFKRKSWLPIPESVSESTSLIDFPVSPCSKKVYVDIVTPYVLTQLMHAEIHIKFVLAVSLNEESVIDPEEIDIVLNHLTRILNDLENYNKSIVLVANNYKKSVSNFQANNLIKNSLLTFKSNLNEGKPLDLKKKTVIDFLLKENRFRLLYEENERKIISTKSSNIENRNTFLTSLKNTNYVKLNISDLNNTIPEEVKQFIKENIFDATKTRIMNMTEIITDQLLQSYKWKGRHNTAMLTYHGELQSVYSILANYIYPYMSRKGFEMTIDVCIDEIRKVSPSIISKSDFSQTLALFDLLQHSSCNSVDLVDEWAKPLIDLKQKIKELLDWYTVFTETYSNAGTIDVQTKKYSTFGDLLDPNYSVYEVGINNFLTKIDAADLADSSTIASLQTITDVDDFLIRDADAIVNLIRPNITCIDGTLKVQSNYIIMSKDVVGMLCTPVNRIEILAMETFFVDADLILNELETHVIIITDSYKIIGGSRIFDVSGKKGASMPAAAQGVDGLAGNPGTPGGSIIAFGNSINTADGTLRFKTSGGDGGDGQNAGKGTDGVDGSTWPPASETRMYYHTSSAYNGAIGSMYIDHCAARGYDSKQTLWNELHCDYGGNDPEYHGDEYHVWGRTSHVAPGDGPNGGKPGLGAKNGNLFIIPLLMSELLPIQTNFGPGVEGNAGAGGEPGKSSQGYGTVMSRCLYKYDIDPFANNDDKTYDCSERCQLPRETYTASSGSAGTAGTQLLPVEPSEVQMNLVVAEYKCMLLKTRFARPRVDFVSKYSKNSKILDYYTLESYLYETKCINSNSGVTRELLHESYIDPLVKKLENWVGTDMEITIANYLRGALTAILWNIETVVPNVFVTDLVNYVDSVRQKVTKLGQTSVKAAAASASNDFTALVDLNIPEARLFVDSFVVDNFDDIFCPLNEITHQNIKDTELLLQEPTINLELLEVELKEMRKNIHGYLQASAFRAIGSALSVLPVIGEATSLCDELLPQMMGSSPTQYFDIFHKTDAVNFAMGEIDKYLNSKMSSSVIHVNMLNYLVDTLADDSPENISALLLQMKQTVNDALLDANSGLMKNPSQRSTCRFYGFNENMTITDKVAKEIECTEYNSLQLIAFEEKIYDKFLPLLLEIKYDFADYLLASVPFSVHNWKLQQFIRDITNDTIVFSDGMDNFKYYFARQDEATNMCVTMFDQIQMYETHKGFSNYISSLTLTPVSGTQYDNEVAYLELSMKQSIINQQVETAEASFLQKVIPLAELHQAILAGYYVMYDTSTISDIKSNCMEKLDYIDNELNFMKTHITESDVNFEFSNFNSQSGNAVPFYSWSYEKHGREIYDVIYGKRTAFVSSVYGTPFKNSVRFSEAVLNFTTANATYQNEFNDILKRFTVVQTHLGNSMFKYVNRTFVVRSNAVPFIYSLERDSSGQPVTSNDMYAKAKQGDIILSPFATWKVMLTERQTGSFQILQDFYVRINGEINIELIGKGKSLIDIRTERENLEDFYDMFSNMAPMSKGYIYYPQNSTFITL